MEVFEINESILNYLKKSNILQQYLKQKQNLLSGNIKNSNLKKRQPFIKQMYYFRINKKYRAIGRIKNNYFVVTEISDHQ